MDELMMIPLGFRFEPTDDELIGGFLFEKVTGGSVPWSGVVDKKIYGTEAEPWVVFKDVDDPAASMFWQTKKEGGATKNTRYVFTTLTRVPKSKKTPRTAGCGGTWSGQTAPKKIKCSQSGATIGVAKMFVYESSKFDVTPTSELGHWIMHEYSLSGLGLEKAGLTACDLVLCKITRSIKRPNVLPHPVPVPPQLNDIVQEDYHYDDVWAAAEASNKRQRAAEEESSRCKKHKGEGEGFSLVHDHDAPGEGDDNIDISWIFDEMEAGELEQGTLVMATSDDHVQHQYAQHHQYAAVGQLMMYNNLHLQEASPSTAF